jgi:hypothetical protein
MLRVDERNIHPHGETTSWVLNTQRAGQWRAKTDAALALCEEKGLATVFQEQPLRLILEQFSVRWTDIGIEARISKFDPEPNPVPTVSIIATREHVDDNWLQAARAVHQRLLERGFQNVQVEIADPLALQVPTCFPVLESDEVFHVWEAICRKILDTFNLREWVLRLHRRDLRKHSSE